MANVLAKNNARARAHRFSRGGAAHWRAPFLNGSESMETSTWRHRLTRRLASSLSPSFLLFLTFSLSARTGYIMERKKKIDKERDD